MQENIDKNRRMTSQELLEFCQLMQDDLNSGVWGQIHGTVTHDEPLLKSLRTNQETQK